MTRPKSRTRRKTPKSGGARPSDASPHTLIVDIGGTGTKTIVVDALGEPVNERARELTPQPATPEAIFALIEKMVAPLPPFDRVSVGFPGVVMHGVIRTAPNLGTELWAGVEIEQLLRQLLHRPVRVINDADLQGYGVIHGRGVELVLTLGTGLGSALFVDGHLVDNLELGHHPFRRNKTYEQRLSDKQLKRIGPKRWTKRVYQAIRQLESLFNYDHLHIGGGNVLQLRGKPPANITLFDNVQGMKGGLRLWRKELPAAAKPPRASKAVAPVENGDGAAQR